MERAHLGRWTAQTLAGLQLGTDLSLPSRAPRYFLDIFKIKKLKQTKKAERVLGGRTGVPAERGPPLRLPLSRGSAAAGARHGRGDRLPLAAPARPGCAPSRPGIGAGVRGRGCPGLGGRSAASRLTQPRSAPHPAGAGPPEAAPPPRAPGPPRPARTAMI